MLAGILKKIAGTAVRALAKDALNLVEKEAQLTPLQAQNFKLKLTELANQHADNAERNSIQAAKDLTDRIAILEGTAADLGESLPGKIVLFLRGAQRPVWGYATLVFVGAWLLGSPSFTPGQEQILYAIVLLVLGFLFGERAVKNVLPLFQKGLGK